MNQKNQQMTEKFVAWFEQRLAAALQVVIDTVKADIMRNFPQVVNVIEDNSKQEDSPNEQPKA